MADGAVAAGAELREAFTVDEVLFEDGRVTGIGGHARGGRPVPERARVVIGADGRHSLVAKAVGAARYHERPALEAGYYAYWSGLDKEGFEVFIRPGRAWAAVPTHDDLTCVVVGWPRAEFAANRVDIEGNYHRSVALSPGFAARLEAATRETRFVGTGDLPNWFRTPYGPGWALVGDAGYHKDPCTAQGISDAFRDAEALAGALDDALAGRQPFEHALGRYQRERDEAALPMFELTCDLATLAPPPPEMQQLLGAVHGRREAMDGFVSMMAGTLPVSAFLGAENTERIMAEAA